MTTKRSDGVHVIVGGGVAGGTAALGLRAAGHEGRVVIVCEEDHPPYSRPPLSKGVVRGEQAVEKAHLRPQKLWDAKDVELLIGRAVTEVDPAAGQVRLSDGEPLAYDKLLLATGGQARALPGAMAHDAVFVLRTIDDCLAIREHLGPGRSIAIVGAGFIGAELAASAIAVGTQVTVFEAAALPLSRVLPPALGEIYARLHRDRGVDLRTSTGVDHLRDAGGRLEVVGTDGEVVEVDAVIVAIGLEADTGLAARAGLDVGDGVLVDELCRTSAADIFAAGDIANHPNPLLRRRVRIEHWQNAQHQAQAAARNMTGAGEPFSEVPWVWSDQYGVSLQVAGLPDPADEIVLRGEAAALQFTAFLLRDGELAAVVGVDTPDEVRAARDLIARGRTPRRELLGDPGTDLATLVDEEVPA
jgi:3-phenylpropionate/trans-cinnamate dioxygenase ferredoxin reductase subunit